MCINPKSRTCDCDACLDERIHVSGMRNRALYNGYTNPLAQWLTSEEWTNSHVHPHTVMRGNVRNGNVWQPTEFVSGEITC